MSGVVTRNQFNAGELGPDMMGRTDVDKYENGCALLNNCLPSIQGPVSLRPGTRFVAAVKYPQSTTRLVTFQFSNEQAYILEFGNQYIRFFMNGGRLLDSSNDVYEIGSPYDETQLEQLQFAQSADVIFITHRTHPPYTLSRYDHTRWTLEPTAIHWPPFEPENLTSDTLQVSDVEGNIDIVSNDSLVFTNEHLNSYIQFTETVEANYDVWQPDITVAQGVLRQYQGNLYRVTNGAKTGTRPPIHTSGTATDGLATWEFLHDGKGYAEITNIENATLAKASVIKRLPESTKAPGSDRWAFSAWSEDKGYPVTLGFFEDRLWFAGSPAHPQTLWASVGGDYRTFKTGTADDDGLSYTINSRELNAIRWIMPGKVLTIGTSGGVFIASGSRPEEAITPTNVRIVRQTTYGTAAIPPLQIGNALLFIQADNNHLREFVYQFESDAYVCPDLTLLASDVLKSREGAAMMSYQESPKQNIWIKTQSGKLVGLSYERTQDVVGWHPHSLGENGKVMSLTTLPHWTTNTQNLWMIVQRTINGSTVQYIEFMESAYKGEDSFYVDCGLTYTGAPTTSLSNFDHLENQFVAIVANGAIHPPRKVTNGSLTFEYPVTKMHAGLSYEANIESTPLYFATQAGLLLDEEITLRSVVMRIKDAGGRLYYSQAGQAENIYLFREDDTMDQPPPLFTGTTEALPLDSRAQIGPMFSIRHTGQLPFTLLAFHVRAS